MDIWQIDEKALKCPVNEDVKRFLRWIWPTKPKSMSFDDAIEGLGFGFEFFYIYLGWRELCRLRPAACRRWLRVYDGWWRLHPYKKWKMAHWRRFLPPIQFENEKFSE